MMAHSRPLLFVESNDDIELHLSTVLNDRCVRRMADWSCTART